MFYVYVLLYTILPMTRGGLFFYYMVVSYVLSDSMETVAQQNTMVTAEKFYI